MAAGGRRPRGGQLPPFESVPAHKQADLRRTHVVWEWAERGQEWGLAGGGNFLLRCRLCGEVFMGSRSRAVEHFTKPKAHCPRRNGEILYILQAAGALLRDALSLRLAAKHADRMDGQFAAEDLRELDEPCDPVPDRAGGVGDGDCGKGGTRQGQDAGTVRDELRGVEGAGDGGGDGGGARVTGTTATTSTQVVTRRRQTTLDVHLGNKVQQDLDRLLALAIYRRRTLLTDGATDMTNKPIMNFIVAGQSRPILIRTIDMSHREKTGVDLAEIWEEVVRDDIGIYNVNAICTDNAEVMKTAVGILQSHPDPTIRRISWILCATHCLSLLLRDIAVQPWAATVMRKAHKIVKFMRNKQRALALHKAMKSGLVLTRPTETRFGTVFMMLERLYEQRGMLDKLVSGELWAQVQWTGDARRDEPEVPQGYGQGWVITHMIVGLESILRGRVKALGLMEDERRAVMDIISDRCRMMRQPAHAAAYLLDPRRHDISLLADRSSSLVQSALDHLARFQGVGWESDSVHKLWQALWTFHCEDPRYWPKSGAHWWDEYAVKDAAEGGMHAAMWWELHGGQELRLQTIAKRFLGMWSTVEDPAEEIEGDDSVPAVVLEEEWEEIDRRNRRKEGRNRFGKGKAPMEDEDEDEEGDEALWQDAVWMHREMMEAQQEQRDPGRTLPEDQHELLDAWSGADPHTDFDAYIGQSVDTVRSLPRRVGGRVDLEELLTRDSKAGGIEVGQEEERSQHVPHSSTDGEGGHTGGVSVDARTSAPAAPHHAGERILRGAEEEMIGREGRHADDRPEDTHQVRQVADQVTHRGGGSQSITHSVVQRVVLRGGDGDGQVAGGGGERRVSDIIRPTVVQTSEQSIGCASSAHVSQRVDDRADPLPASVAELGVEQRVEQRVDGMVQDRAEQRADQRIEHRREQRNGHSLEVQVDVTMDESVVRWTEDRASERRGVASTRESMIQSEDAQVATEGGGEEGE
ncbi:hypothetical protein CBR_g55025 [Chara braunii]|uniref:DUF659 domain-containing protein n=1 Tax=Chara braunii TaxID=69332 RepID=A0A388MCG6_CHABU|nr:hypothetical protein CBR_g55025 [Chara braunii]|eukprot:GBG92256.1 hypothetical protein CBR_g55025 [Chara braunii]